MSEHTSPRGRPGDDDFTVIVGIGPNLNRRLHHAGVTTYAELAALDADQIAALLAGAVAVSPTRIWKEGWSGQAARLATAAARTDESTAEAPGDRQHYESFVVRLLVDDADRRVRALAVQHVGSGEEQRLVGLDQSALLAFIAAHISAGNSTGGAPTPEARWENEDQEVVKGLASNARAWSLSGASVTVTPDRGTLRANEPFTVAVTLGHVEPPPPDVTYAAVVLARPLGGGTPRRAAAGADLLASEVPTIGLYSAGLPAGVYQLEAVVQVFESGSTRPRDQIAGTQTGVTMVD